MSPTRTLSEPLVLYSAAGFRPVDDFTRRMPIGNLLFRLDMRQADAWQPTDVEAVITPSGHVTYPGLGRTQSPLAAPVHRFRLRVEDPAGRYRPLYRADSEGVEFQAFPYNDTNPPAEIAVLSDLVLIPSTSYLFPAYIPLLRGVVVRGPAGAPVPDAVVESVLPVNREATRTERTLTDQTGSFRLPLRWARPGTVQVTATDRRTNQTRTIDVAFPADLRLRHRIDLADEE